MKRLLKWLVIISILAGVIVSITIPVMSWWQQHAAPKYLTTTVSRGRVESVVNSTGTVKPVRTVSVGAFTSGPIAQVLVDFNSVVEENQLLAQIDPRLLQAAVDRDQAAVDTQKAELERIKALMQQAHNNEGRAKHLLDLNLDYISKTEWDQFFFTARTFDAQYKLALANIAQAEATLKNSAANLEYTKIRAPKEFSTSVEPTPAEQSPKPRRGKIIERKVDPGQTVAASFQTPELFTIALEMDEHMYVYGSVDEADVGLIKAAQKQNRLAKFTVDAYPGELFEGVIHDIRLNSTTTQNVVTYPVIIDAPNREQKLMPGMTANITFQIQAKENVLRVPANALRFTPLSTQVHPDDRHYLQAITTTQSGDGTKRTASEKADLAQSRHRRVLWVQDEEWLRAVPVTLGLIENRFAELISDNLKEGQAIVTGTEGALSPR